MEPQQNNIFVNNPGGASKTNMEEEARREKKKFGRGTAAVVVAALALVISAGSGTLTLMMFMENRDGTGASVNGGNYLDGNSANFTEGSIAETASKVAPAVVSILTTVDVRGVFGRSETSSGAGTGMIVTPDGYVMTNKHVIDGASTVTVVTDDGDTYEDVQVVGVDPLNDVAYLKIADVRGLPTVVLGDSKTITVGQSVITVGNALGQYANTISSGVVSGTGRNVTAMDSGGGMVETLSDMIQTDAAINLGNSGGPLVNAAGEVIGINTAVSTDAQGIGFAIPISSTKGMLGRIVAGKKAERAYIGVNYIPITPEVAKMYELSVKAGAYIYREDGGPAIVEGGPADRAGIQDGDIVLAVNGVKIGARGSISSLVGEHAVGSMVELSVLRDKREVTISVELGAYPGE